jgi:hypothetical protein
MADHLFHREHNEREFLHLVRDFVHSFERFVSIFNRLVPHHAASATLQLSSKGAPLTMPLTIQVGQSFSAALTEWSGPNGTGSVVPPVTPPTYASDTPATATISADGTQGIGIAVGTTNISGLDSGDGMTASDVLTVVAAGPVAAVSATIALTAGPVPASATKRRF